MNIVNITPLFPPHLGGVERVAEGIGIALAQDGHTVTVITSNLNQSEQYVDPIIEGYRVIRLKSSLIFNLPIMWNLLPRLLMSKRKNTIFHVHIAQAFMPEIVLFVAKLKRIPFVAHFHLDVEPSGQFGLIFSIYKRTLLPIMLRAADIVIVLSNSQAVQLTKRYGVSPNKIEVISNSVNNDFYRDERRTLNKKPHLLFVGRLSPQKNVKQILEALYGVSDQFKTDIVGEGELKADLKELSKELKLKNINFHGRADGSKLLDYYKDADIFMLSSEREGMPLVLLEAMAMSLPIIATNVKGNRDVIVPNENGLLVKLNDAESMRDALLKISSDKKLYSAMSAASYRMSKKYSWNNTTKILSNLYERVYDQAS